MNHSSSFNLGDDIGVPVDEHFLFAKFDFGSSKLRQEDGISHFNRHRDDFAI